MLVYGLLINHNLLHLVGLTPHFILRMHGHTKIKFAHGLSVHESSWAISTPGMSDLHSTGGLPNYNFTKRKWIQAYLFIL